MENVPATEHLSRPQAIERIRGALLARAVKRSARAAPLRARGSSGTDEATKDAQEETPRLHRRNPARRSIERPRFRERRK
jgi:hypothetical protein